MNFGLPTIAVLLLVFVYIAVRENQKRRRLERTLQETSSALAESRAAAAQAAKMGQQFEGERNALAAGLVELEERFQPVVDLDKEAALVQVRIDETTAALSELRASYSDKRTLYDRLLNEVAVFDDRLAFAEMGVYEPHFDYTDSEAFKESIEASRIIQKGMVSSKTAVVSQIAWTLDGSTAKGQIMTNRNVKLSLRAFNSECDAAIANARWNNVNALEKRIVNAFTQVNKLNESNRINVTESYLKLKLQELHLTHEYKEKIKSERDERAELVRAQKEEQKLIRDMERAEEDEAKYQRLLDKARLEAERAVGPKLEAFNAQIAMLERDLADAQAKVERAQAMAEKTRSGYVYIISNVGSFGEDVVKIGLTRRLDPSDRVRELGDASVPFIFDTHAIIYSDNAPTLERALHNEFEAVRVNARNYRKEFFRARLDDVEAAVKRLAPDAPFFKDIEAQDYRETLAKRNAALASLEFEREMRLPVAI
ncbi:chromosome partitioning protein ParA [Rhizobium tubonense]|uniref:Chromosome partitioning protein ParA n=2 Tax=Rhizobium tubonense TaxID=484088 RepID=A0A2W4C4Y0_9HYPH|nr:chromosome partitioning protein ParA [Rhizobium tubonense]